MSFRLLPAAAGLASALAACSAPDKPASSPVPPAPAAAQVPAPARSRQSSPAPFWEGEWTCSTEFTASQLTITPNAASADAFDFELQAQSGAHTGEVAGTARIRNGQARYTSAGPDAAPCALTFRLSTSGITVEQNTGDCGAGVGVDFAGRYVRATGHASARPARPAETTMLALGVFHDAQEDEALRKLVGTDYRRFTESSQLVSEETDSEFLGATVYDSHVRGLGTIQQNIIIVDGQRDIWAGVVAGDSILYYTSRPDYARRLPGSLERWRTVMGPEKVLIYMSAPR